MAPGRGGQEQAGGRGRGVNSIRGGRGSRQAGAGRGGGQGVGVVERVGRGGDEPASVVEGFSQVAGPARAAGGDPLGGRGVGRGASGPEERLSAEEILNPGDRLQTRPGDRGRGAVGRGGGQAGGGRGNGGRGGNRIRARAWVFTINNPRDTPRELPRGPPPVRYLCFGEEVSQNGTPHLQGYVVFENAVSQPSQYFRQYGNGHFEVAKGTASENIRYCSKDGKFSEYGVRPQDKRDQGHHGAKGGEMEVDRWEEAWQAAKRGKIEELPADIRWRFYSTFKKVAAEYKEPPAKLEKLNNLWIVGPSGTGKSHFAHETYPGAYKKEFNKWWDNYREENEAHQTVILDDLHYKWAKKERLKNWADIYPFMAEYKGGSMLIRPKRIVVTSNYHPHQVRSYSSPSTHVQYFKLQNFLLVCNFSLPSPGVLRGRSCSHLEAFQSDQLGRPSPSTSKAN